jgi:sugar phosphate isomerase/epimerase
MAMRPSSLSIMAQLTPAVREVVNVESVIWLLAMARLGPGDLVLCAGTVPKATFRARVAAAAAGGFMGISLWLPHRGRAQAEGLSDTDMRAILGDHGLVVTDVEAITDFGPCFRGGADMAREPTAQERLAYEVASAVGATTVTVVEGPGEPMPVEPAAEAFALLCDRAAARGLDVAIEFWPHSAIGAREAAAIVASAVRENGGLLVDTWHAHHEPQAGAVLRALHGGVESVQVADVGSDASPDYFAATMHARRLPGDGGAELVSWIRLLDAIGARAPLGVEVLSDALHALAPDEAARRAGNAMRDLLAAARPGS